MHSAVTLVNHLADVASALPAAPSPSPAPTPGGGSTDIPFVNSDRVKVILVGLLALILMGSGLAMTWSHRKQNLRGQAEKVGTAGLGLVVFGMGLVVALVLGAITGTLTAVLPG